MQERMRKMDRIDRLVQRINTLEKETAVIKRQLEVQPTTTIEIMSDEERSKRINELQKEQFEIKKSTIDRKRTINKIIQTILNELEEPGKGNLTTTYAIGVLEEAIEYLESNAFMCPVRQSLKDES